ncbi:response regulator transcription factor [Arthrobacter sp. D3-16]
MAAADTRLGGRLTAPESEVLQLLTEGHTNSQIAARLFISKRTVEHHVGSILAKLGKIPRDQAMPMRHSKSTGQTLAPVGCRGCGQCFLFENQLCPTKGHPSAYETFHTENRRSTAGPSIKLEYSQS